MSSKRASMEAMGVLHNLTAELLTQQLNGMLNGDIPADPKILANVIKFLKDNNIECLQDEMIDMFKEKGITLPSFEEMALEREGASA